MPKHESSTHSMLNSLKIGAISGAVEAAVNHPLWAWKVRSQNNMGFTLNPAVIYRGVLTNIGIVSTVTALRITINNQCIKNLYHTPNPSLSQSMVSSLLAGLGGASIFSMVELGMTQQQKIPVDKRSGTFVSTYLKLIHEHGIARGFTGMGCVVVRDSLFCMSFLGMAPHLKKTLQSDHYKMDPIPASICAGTLIGAPIAIAAQPCDRIAAVSHANAPSANKHERSAFAISKKIINEQGFIGFYRNGFLPRALRIASAIVIFSELTEELENRL